MSGGNDLHYDAFISYRHNEFDSFVAENLHKKLESFKLPKSVLPKVASGKKKIERVFRDVDELPLTDNLSDPISKALLNSDFLITICTPRYPESRWCMKEIEVFLQTHPRDHILVVLAEDEPVNSFPEILCYEDIETTTENGETIITRRELEPLAADTRGGTKKEVLKAMDIAVIKLCAAMFGLNYDDLKQRHREQRMRRLATIFGSIGAAVLAFAIFATVMLIKISAQNVTINKQYRELQDSFASSMAAASGNLMKAGRRKDAVYAVRSVLPDDEEEGYNADALKALYESMDVYKMSGGHEPVCAYDAGSMLYNFYVSGDGKYVLLNEDKVAYVCDAETGSVLHTIVSDNGWIQSAFCGEEGVLWGNGENCYYYSFETKESTPVEVPADASFFVVDDGTMVLIDSFDNILYAVGDGGQILFKFDHSDVFEEFVSIREAWLSGNVLTCCFSEMEENYFLVKINTTDGKMLDLYKGESFREPVVYLGDDVLYVAAGRYEGELLSCDITLMDPESKKEKWKTTLEDFEVIYGFFRISDKYLYICGKTEVAILEPKTGELVKRYYAPGNIFEAWIEDGQLYYLTGGSKVFSCSEYNQADATEVFFKTVPGLAVSDATYKNGDLYCVFNSESYVTRYSDKTSTLAARYDGDFDTEMMQSYLPEEVFTDSEKFDVNQRLVDFIYYSEDKKYIMTALSNHTACIYDAETGEKVSSFATSEDNFYSFGLSDLTGSYVLRGEKIYIFDKDMRIVCEIGSVFGETNEGIIVYDNEGEYLLPFVDYKGICKMADEYLADYAPPGSIKQKYGLK